MSGSNVQASAGRVASRVDWVDAAKGICIILVVMMHSTLGVQDRLGVGYMDWPVAFAKPFRMPDFFLLSGLFLAATINRPWALYTDRKVVHFAYFYVLWFVIQFGLKLPIAIGELGVGGALLAAFTDFVNPHSTLWFIYILPFFFIATRLLRAVPVAAVFLIAVALNAAPISTGAVLIDQFATQYVYFFAGYAFAPWIFRLAEWARSQALMAAALLGAWFLVNTFLAFTPAPAALDGFSDVLADLPLMAVALGFAGAMAIVMFSSLLTMPTGRDWPRHVPPRPITRLLQHAGANSIAIYLAFFFPMGVTRSVLIKFVPELGSGTIALVTTTVAVLSPLALLWLINRFNLGHFLFRRPAWAVTAWKPGERENRQNGRGPKAQIAPAE
ncbi:MAG: acyltransferase family protein [Pseudomonadota bacterium]